MEVPPSVYRRSCRRMGKGRRHKCATVGCCWFEVVRFCPVLSHASHLTSIKASFFFFFRLRVCHAVIGKENIFFCSWTSKRLSSFGSFVEIWFEWENCFPTLEIKQIQMEIPIIFCRRRRYRFLGNVISYVVGDLLFGWINNRTRFGSRHNANEWLELIKIGWNKFCIEIT